VTVRGPGDLELRERRRMARPQYDGSRAAYSVMFGLAVFLLVGALSMRQLTERDVAHQLIVEGVVALVDVDLVLAEREAELESAAAAAAPNELITIPGYPLPVRLTAAEVQDSDAAELRALVINRSASIIYDEGLDAFDQSGGSSLSMFSREGMLDSLVGQLSSTNHRRAGIASVLLGVFAALAAAMVVLRTPGFRRVRALAVPIIGASIAGVVGVGVILDWILGRWWGGDPFSDQVDTIIGDAVEIGRENYLVLGALGLVLLVGGIALELLGRAMPSAAPGPDAP
jgi:hypothetical protein